VSVAAPALAQVAIRTTFAQVTKPATVAVTFSNGAVEQVPVTWLAGNYNGLVAGDYQLVGELTVPAGKTNVDNIKATWVVRVLPNKAPTNIALSKTVFQPSISATEAIGTFTSTDEDDPFPGDRAHIYTLVETAAYPDNNLFEIRGDQLFLKSNHNLSGKSSFTIKVQTKDAFNNTFAKTFTLTKEQYAKQSFELKIVNAFTPNGDGVNDTWTVPELRFYNNVEVQVFDRSGVQLFHSTNPEMTWDGRDANGKVLAGSYLVIIQIKDINYVKRGTVTILKK
jgi:gliding motility-associated-like protein